jgi:hypothetical protein
MKLCMTVATISDGENVPICEDCDSKFGIGLKPRTLDASNPEQAKDFASQSISY